MKPGDLSTAASRLAAAISQIEAEVARMNGVALPTNEFSTTVPSAEVPTVPIADNAADEQPADSRALLPPVDLGRCKVVSLSALRRRRVSKPRQRSSRKRTEATE